MGRACVAAGVRRPIMRESWSKASYPFVRARRPVCARAASRCVLAPPPDLPQSRERANHIVVVRHPAQKNTHNCNAKLFKNFSAAKLHEVVLPSASGRL